MKKLLLTSFLLISFLGFGQCPTDNITITTQAEIDNFAITYPGCTNFEVSLTIEGLSITNLNGLIQLQQVVNLIIRNTNIVDFTGLDQLTSNNYQFSIYNNNSLINFTGLGQLNTVGDLDVSYNDNLQSFEGIGGITHFLAGEGLLIVGNPSLTTLEHLTTCIGSLALTLWENNALTNLNGLENIGNLYSFSLLNNSNLTNIDALAYVPVSVFSGVWIDGNPNLMDCSIANICYLLDNGQGNANIQNNGAGCNSAVEILDNCTDGLNIITGKITYDLQANNCVGGGVNFSSVLVGVTNGTISSQTITNEIGEYTFFVGEGTFTTSVNINSIPSYMSVVANDIQTTFIDTGNTEQIDFCLTANAAANDLKVTILPLNILRPGFESDFKLVVENIGTTTLDGTVTVQFDDGRLTFISANPVETNTTASSISWDFTSLLPFSSEEFLYTLDSFQPPINELGDITSFHAEITPITGDETPLDNVYELYMEYVNAMDPNDKAVNQGSEIEIGEVGEYLEYTIRFQNLGNADAVNVRVIDVLSENLNWDSFRPLSSSHEYSVEISNGNHVSFNFDDINLPPEVSDPEGSNGFIAFQIRSDTNLQLGDYINNTANIYFDFNDPILTNTVRTTVVAPLSILEVNLANSVFVYPNPTSELITIHASEGITVERARIYSIIGAEVLDTDQKKINTSTLSEGIYFIEIVTDKGSVTKRIIKN